LSFATGPVSCFCYSCPKRDAQFSQSGVFPLRKVLGRRLCPHFWLQNTTLPSNVSLSELSRVFKNLDSQANAWYYQTLSTWRLALGYKPCTHGLPLNYQAIPVFSVCALEAAQVATLSLTLPPLLEVGRQASVTQHVAVRRSYQFMIWDCISDPLRCAPRDALLLAKVYRGKPSFPRIATLYLTT